MRPSSVDGRSVVAMATVCGCEDTVAEFAVFVCPFVVFVTPAKVYLLWCLDLLCGQFFFACVLDSFFTHRKYFTACIQYIE